MSEIKAPWESEECFPEKPASSEYGYLLGDKPTGCSREELIQRCSSDKRPEVELVWHPDAARVVPAFRVPFLKDALKTRTQIQLKGEIKANVIISIVFPLSAWALFKTGVSLGYPLSLAFFAVIFGFWPLWRNLRLVRIVDASEWKEPTPQDLALDRYLFWVGTRPIFCTWFLLAMMAMVFIFQYFRGLSGSFTAAGLDKNAVRLGEWWRLVTAPLLHGMIIHFVFNAMALHGLGRQMEVLGSRCHLMIVFLLSAISANVFSLFLKPQITSVGASGGLMGLIGFLMVLGYRRKTILPPDFGRIFAINIFIMAIIGYIGQAYIDNAAHLGGLVGGMILGLMMIRGKEGTLPLPCSGVLKVTGILATIAIVASTGLAVWKILGR